MTTTTKLENMSVEEKLVYYQNREQELLASLEFYDKVHAMQARGIRKYEVQIPRLNGLIDTLRSNNQQLLEELGDALFEVHILNGDLNPEPALEDLENNQPENSHPAP
tara:strand:- start:5661 stop:5984 length:324 start_codon:yes stop_codon:yes gene_type:complete